MEEQESSSNEEHKEEQTLPPTRGSTGGDKQQQVEVERAQTQTSEASGRHHPSLWAWWEKIDASGSNRIIAAATVVMAVTTIIAAGISASQGIILFRQLAEMQKASEQTERAIRETGRIAAGMDSVRRQSRAALDASIEMARTDQRAWLSVYVTSETPRIGHNLTIRTHVKNTGKTFAKDATLCSLPTNTETLRQIPQFVECTEDKLQHGTLMAPNDEWTYNTWYTHPSGSRTVGLTRVQVEELNANKVVMWQYGRVTYSDIFGRDHWVKFCSRGIVRDRVLQFWRCPNGNEIDDG